MSSPDEKKRRLFFALWPDSSLRKAFQAVNETQRVGGKRMDFRNYHLTLRFLGCVSEGEYRCLLQRASDVTAALFTLAFDTLGHFRRSQTLWLGMSCPPVELFELYERLDRLAMECGLPAEKRPFNPHLTLRRHARNGPENQASAPIIWRADSFVLVESETLPEGARYHVLQRWPLISCGKGRG